MLKIGTLCWVIKGRHHPEWAGRVVTITGPLCMTRSRAWIGERMAYKCDLDGMRVRIVPACLLPFSDPDISRPEFTAKPVERVA